MDLAKPWQGTVEEVISELSTSKEGLSDFEAEKRILKYGFNTISRQTPIPYFQLFFDQFIDLLVLLLIGAALLSFALGDIRNGIIISAIILLNALIGFTQEFKAEKILKALVKLLPEIVKVRRSGVEKEIAANYLVPGDIVVLGEGDKVPADIRLLEVYELTVNEQVLTGESLPQNKSLAGKESSNYSITEVENTIFMGTTIVSGEALGLVTATAKNTQFGKIAEATLKIDKTLSPLQVKTHQMAKRVAILAVLIMFFLVCWQYFSGRLISEALIFSVAVAAALVPEGLPATVSVALSLGASNLAKKKALVKNLVSVETLGSVTVICTDKTGTLTTGKMEVKEFWRNPVLTLTHDEFARLISEVSILCNDSQIKSGLEVGDPTEIALLKWSQKEGFDIDKIRGQYLKQNELPFNSKRRFMEVTYIGNGKNFTCRKGAPEILIEKCDIKGEEKLKITEKFNGFALKGMRVLGLSYDDLFLGLVAIFDPPREEAAAAIAACEKGDIRVLMLTGDNPLTAEYIARETGIVKSTPIIATGDQLDKMSDIELRNFLRKANIFARIIPEQKFRIVENLMKNGEIVAVTGDGVNDAPALKKADIGVSMGVTGSDVSKESADMVLLDDNFSTIVSAVREGRIIFDNIKKFLFFIFAHNFGELGIVLLGIFLNLPLPMLAVQILAVDLGTDVLPSMSLIAEKGDEVMNSKPRSKEVQLLTGESFVHLFLIGLIVGVGAIINFKSVLGATGNYSAATTISFTTLAIAQAFYVFMARTPDKSIFKYRFWQNKYLFGAIAISLVILFLIIYWKVFNSWFLTSPFPSYYWIRILIIGFLLIAIEELYKVFRPKLFAR